MPPELIHNWDTKKQGWGTGLEQFRFHNVPGEAREWWEKTKIPRIITPEVLSTAPDSALVLLRSITRRPLLEGMAIGNAKENIYPNQEAETVRDEMLPTTPRVRLGEISKELTDGGKTENWILPLITDKGTIQVVVNSAWGVGWRLAQGHPLTSQYSQLAVVQNPDISEPTVATEEGILRRDKFLPLEVLAQATKTRIDPEQLIKDTKVFLGQLFSQPDLKIIPLHMSGGAFPEENSFSVVKFETSDHLVLFEILLGNSSGVKMIDIKGYRAHGTNEISEIAALGNSLGRRISSLHELREQAK